MILRGWYCIFERKQHIYDHVILKTDAIGDFFVALPFIKAYVQHVQALGNSVLLVGSGQWRDVHLQELPQPDFVEVDRLKMFKNLVYRFKLLAYLVQVRANRAIYWSFSPEVGSGVSLLRAVQAQEKIGPAPDGVIDQTTHYQTNFYKHLQFDASVHEIFKHKNLLTALGLSPLKYETRPGNGRGVDSEYVVLFPGARLPYRMWGEQQWKALLSWILEHTDKRIHLLGSKAEATLAARLIPKHWGHRVFNQCGLLSLTETLALVRGAALVVGNESAGIHIAVYAGVPNICIAGGGHFGRFVPYPDDMDSGCITVYSRMDCFGCNWHCTQRADMSYTVPCIERITVEQVIEAIERIL